MYNNNIITISFNTPIKALLSTKKYTLLIKTQYGESIHISFIKIISLQNQLSVLIQLSMKQVIKGLFLEFPPTNTQIFQPFLSCYTKKI